MREESKREKKKESGRERDREDGKRDKDREKETETGKESESQTERERERERERSRGQRQREGESERERERERGKQEKKNYNAVHEHGNDQKPWLSAAGRDGGCVFSYSKNKLFFFCFCQQTNKHGAEGGRGGRQQHWSGGLFMPSATCKHATSPTKMILRQHGHRDVTLACVTEINMEGKIVRLCP